MTPKITLYVDTVSPFGYEAYYILRNDPVFAKCDITYIPIFLGGVMKACGNSPPVGIKNKGAYIMKERLRWAKRFNVPMAEEMPPDFPAMTLTIMRALCALTVLHPGPSGQGILIKCLDALFAAYWVDLRRTHDKNILSEVLVSVLGENEADKVIAMAGKEGKEVLMKNSDQAVADGAFGLPWFVAEDESGKKETFWGVDHLGMLAGFLDLPSPGANGGWKSVL